jgi:transcriptional regulator with XRE-family HTH domain
MVKLTRLRSIRERSALTQFELAERAGLSKGAILKIEAGRSEPRPATIRKLAEALGVQPTQLMEPEQ